MKMNYIQNFTLAFVLPLLFHSCKENQIEKNNLKKIQKVTNSNNFKLSKTANNSNYIDFLPISTTHQIVKHQYYTLSYSEKYEQAEWVAYELKNPKRKRNHFKRPFFIDDPKVTSKSANWKNYKNSGFDKGHLCPAADMSFEKSAYDDTFFTSNISPQLHEFNDGVWNRLEEKVRYWSEKQNGVFVITGGVLTDALPTIGKEKVAIPERFYKIILNYKNGNYKAIAFLIPNSKSDKPLYTYVVSINEIEKITGIDFFPSFENTIENKLEKNKDYKEWSFN
jgi:endonuclease G